MATSFEYEDGMGAVAWQLACTRLAERGAHVLQSAQWSDCVLAVGRERREVRAHRLLLAMASPVLAHMLYVEWSPEQPGSVPVPDLEPDAFRAMLLYIYTDCVEITSDSAARELYYAAQRFALPHLLEACSAHLAASLTPDNVCATLEVVEVLGDDERLDAPLREQCLQLMRSETAQVLSASGFLSAKSRTVETLFALEPLQIHSEMELFRAAERYAAHRTSTRANFGGLEEAEVEAEVDVKEALRGALQHIRFLTLEAPEFTERDVSSLLSGPEQLAILHNILSANAHHPMPSGLSANRRHRNKRMPGPGAFDWLRPAARMLISLTLVDPHRSGGFSLQCLGSSEKLSWPLTSWSCAARGHLRLLRGSGEEEGERRTFDHTFTSKDWRIDWYEFTSWSALAACAERGRFTIEVELSADPPE